MNKKCTRCEEDKTPDEFARNATKSDGLQAQCKSCMKQVRSQLDFRDYMESESNRQRYNSTMGLFKKRFGKARV